MRRLVASGLLALSLGVTALTPAARADTVQSSRFDIEERTHAIDVKIDRGVATLVVTRVVANPGPRSDQAIFHLDVPEGAVATRLRTAAGEGSSLTWFEGELLEAEEAARRYKELTGLGGFYPKDPALLSWRSQRHLALQVFPVPPRATKTVEYTLTMPTRYEGGAYHLTLPTLGTEAMPATVRVEAAQGGDSVQINGASGGRSTTAVASRELEIVLKPSGAPQLSAGIASQSFANNRVLVHARLDAAPRLSATPQGASIVVVLDTSRSMERSLDSELAAARAYLSHFARADVEVLTFDRTVKRAFGRPLPVKEALARLHALSPRLGNGSRIDDAIAAADALLSQASSKTRRVLVLTDLLTRSSLSDARISALTVNSGAVLHVATVDAGSPSLARDDEGAWASLPRKTGGVLWHAHCSPGDPANRKVLEELARPMRIDHLKVTGLPEGFSAPGTLDEGAGLEHLSIEAAHVAKVKVEGELWSKKTTFSFEPSASEGKLWSALVFGSSLVGELTEPEMMRLAMHGRAVSPVTSYLAIEPGVRPSTDGLDEGEGLGLGGLGMIGHGSGFGLAGGSLSSDADARKALAGALEAAMGACKVSSGEARATIETTLAEIVDIDGVALSPSRDAVAERCIAEQLWAFEPPARGFFRSFASFTVTASR